MLKRLEEDGAADCGAAKPAPAQRACEGLPKKVLIAEDNIVSQQAAKRFLEAIAACERNYPGLFIGGQVSDGISLPNCVAAGRKLASEATATL